METTKIALSSFVAAVIANKTLITQCHEQPQIYRYENKRVFLTNYIIQSSIIITCQCSV